MVILFKSEKLRAICNDDKKLHRHYGAMAKTIRNRLDDFDAADSLNVIRTIPQHRCHELTGNRKGQLSVDLKHPYRLIFVPADDPPAVKDDGGFDWQRIRTIMIIEITDPH